MNTHAAGKTSEPIAHDGPGISFERIVVRIQQMMDSNSIVSHNEKLTDRIGNRRQYDVVIRGHFGARPILGIMECKDHSRKKGPDSVEAFAKKTEILGANLRIMVSRKGFTKQALDLAKHEHIGCLSLLPDDPAQAGFSVGEMWYGVIRIWKDVRLAIIPVKPDIHLPGFDSNTVKFAGKPAVNWFLRELFTTYGQHEEEGPFYLSVTFDEAREVEIEGGVYLVSGIAVSAQRVNRKKKKWVSWSGDAFYDWHSQTFTVPAQGRWWEVRLRPTCLPGKITTARYPYPVTLPRVASCRLLSTPIKDGMKARMAKFPTLNVSNRCPLTSI